MQRIAKFEKVSFQQFKKDWLNCYPECNNEDDIRKIYDQIKLPKRATTDSAGCDFFAPSNLTIYPSDSQIINSDDSPFKILKGDIKIPTGIRCYIEKGWLLQIYPRSSLGFKFGLHLANTVGIIDGDYYNSDNEGHIFVKLINDSSIRSSIKIKAGQEQDKLFVKVFLLNMVLHTTMILIKFEMEG